MTRQPEHHFDLEPKAFFDIGAHQYHMIFAQSFAERIMAHLGHGSLALDGTLHITLPSLYCVLTGTTVHCVSKPFEIALPRALYISLIQGLDQGLLYYLESLTLHTSSWGRILCIVVLPFFRHSFLYKFHSV